MQVIKTRRIRICGTRALGFWIAMILNCYGLTAQKTIQTKDTLDRLEEIVISGTLQEVSKSSSSVPIELYTAQFFRSNPAPSLFEGLFQVNGVQPQVNCNVCSAGDIHINGMEGPYTLVLIDGMPIVSGLSTVYGLFGIPQSLIDRVEIVKGPASTLYGSEAVGGLINVITKKSSNAPRFVVDLLQNSWGEFSADIGGKLTIAKNHHLLLGLNTYNYQQLHDKNKDNFTDIPQVQRASVFAKWNIQRKEFRTFSVAMRWVGENRWGGDIRWNEQFQGGDSIYGEQIATNRWEIFGTYQLPTIENIKLQFSGNGHDQHSYYGKLKFQANQQILFGQLLWNKSVSKHSILAGFAYRFTYYDDNTPATFSYRPVIASGINMPSRVHLPGFFLQDEIVCNNRSKFLFGIRYDIHSVHGTILSPRVNYKWNSKNNLHILRWSLGNGYRVANIFTEDHASLTGARTVVFQEELNPEQSWNSNINWNYTASKKSDLLCTVDASLFYTHFSNKIIADYDSDPNTIFYSNLNGYSVSRGISANINTQFYQRFTANLGVTVLDVFVQEAGTRWTPLFQSRFSGVWLLKYHLPQIHTTLEYTGNFHSPMRLPLLGNLDPRQEYSPWWSLQNIQISTKINPRCSVNCGIKNLLNWTPAKQNPFLIARAHDPFDKQVEYSADGQVLPTLENPYALTFDPSYVYAPNQGRRIYLGLSVNF